MLFEPNLKDHKDFRPTNKQLWPYQKKKQTIDVQYYFISFFAYQILFRYFTVENLRLINVISSKQFAKFTYYLTVEFAKINKKKTVAYFLQK